MNELEPDQAVSPECGLGARNFHRNRSSRAFFKSSRSNRRPTWLRIPRPLRFSSGSSGSSGPIELDLANVGGKDGDSSSSNEEARGPHVSPTALGGDGTDSRRKSGIGVRRNSKDSEEGGGFRRFIVILCVCCTLGVATAIVVVVLWKYQYVKFGDS